MVHNNGAAVEPTPPLREATRAAWRHKGKMALFIAAVMTAVALYTFFGPHAYRSEAKLFLRLGRENATLDPTATVGQSPLVTVEQSRENEINSVIEILKSRNLIEKVVDSVGPRAILGREPPHDPAAAGADAASADREEAIRTVIAQLDVEAAKRSDVVVVSYDGPSPELARAVVSRLMDIYQERHLTLNRTPGEHKFLEDQADRLRADLEKTEEDLRDLKNATGLASPDAQRQLLVARVGRLEDESMQAATELAAAEAQVQALRDRLAALAANEVTARTTGMPNVAADTMRGQLYALQLKEQELLAQHPEQHPDVVAVRKEIEGARAILAREEGAREQVTTGPNRVHEEVQVALLKEEPVAASLQARVASLKEQLARERDRLKTLTGDETRVARLQRQVDLKDGDYRKCAAGLEQARIDEALGREKISNLEVVEPATYDPKAVRPRLSINFGAGLAFAVSGALALALLAERLRRKQRPVPDGGPAPAARELNHVAAG